uniref:Uncharacterized protein n=1 Tax=Octopus bimaculoides TaxID=37653 RepID=A0A0L8HZV4_OCTBM
MLRPGDLSRFQAVDCFFAGNILDSVPDTICNCFLFCYPNTSKCGLNCRLCASIWHIRLWLFLRQVENRKLLV